MPDPTAPRTLAPPAAAAMAAARRAWLSAGTALRRLLAPRCLLCATAAGDPLCGGCLADYFDAGARRCRCCALRLGPGAGALCGRCLRRPPAFDATLALADYAPPVDGLVVALKFGHRLAIARALGELLAARLPPLLPEDALLAAVPLSFERQSERGFNQAQEIARAAARRLGRPLARGLLLRARHRPPQEGLDLAARRRNLRGAFVVPAESVAALHGRCVVVIDDVMTSGSTLDEVARTLRRAGAARVLNAVAARTP